MSIGWPWGVTWEGRRDLAVVLANFSDVPPGPADWQQRTASRFYAFRDYLQTVSYAAADLGFEIFGPVQLQARSVYRGDYGPAVQEAITAAQASDPLINDFVFGCVALNEDGGGGWAYPGGSLTQGPPVNTCWVHNDAGLGVVAMENTHIIAFFGDLYLTSDHPGDWDNMACNCGVHPGAYTKMAMGWLNAQVLASVATGYPGGASAGTADFHVVLHDLASPTLPPGRSRGLIVRSKALGVGTYFIAEARFQSDQYERRTLGVSAGIPAEGVLVYYVDENNWPPLHIRTPYLTPLSTVGASFSDARTGVTITIAERDDDAFAVDVVGPAIADPPPDCDGLQNQLADIDAEMADLRDRLPTAVGSEKAMIVHRLRELQARRQRLVQRARLLGCPGI